MPTTIMDYIIDQMEQFDITNVVKEYTVISAISNQYEEMIKRIEGVAIMMGSMTSLAGAQLLINKVVECIKLFEKQSTQLLAKQTKEYQQMGYNHIGEIIDMANEIQKQQSKVSEMKMYDPNTIVNISDHACEQVTKFTNEKMSYVREEINKLFTAGEYNQKNIAKILETVVGDKYRARLIAQTEMSFAYNKGVIERLYEFKTISGLDVKKYWYGFKYSEHTCKHCKPHIGSKFALDDDTYSLPLHPNCRCVWLPYIEGWDTPITVDITRNADMLKRTYSSDEIYRKINTRLGINYAQYLADGVAIRYIGGERGEEMANEFDNAKNIAVSKYIDDFGVKLVSPTKSLSTEYQQQMSFWSSYVASNMADDMKDNLVSASKGIKGTMALPWSGKQLNEFNKLLIAIDRYLSR